MAQLYYWRDYEKIKSIKGFDSIKLSYNGLTSLLSHICLKNEYIILKSVSKRITIRLRSAKVSQLIKQTIRSFCNFFELNLLENVIQNISTLVNEKYETSSGSILLPFKDEIVLCMEILVKSAPLLRKMILNSFNTFSHCMPWLRLGHLAPHFLMMSSCSSRLNVLSKAILVYVNDLYSALNQIKHEFKERNSIYKSKTDSLPHSLDNYLLELNIKCNSSFDELNNSEVTICEMNQITKIEDIGVPINRRQKEQQLGSNRKSNRKRKRFNKIEPKVKKCKRKTKS